MTNLHLSPHELHMIGDSEWILTKQQIIQKVFEFFGGLIEEYRTALKLCDPFPVNISDLSGKISRGENYLGLPYVILDYPATFSRNGVLAVRTMFWWGNFFSITLHVSGSFKDHIILNEDAIIYLNDHGFYLSTGKEWDHHFENDNYKSTSDVKTISTTVDAYTHFKIAKKIDLMSIEKPGEFLSGSFKEIVEFLEISYRGGKRDL